MIDKMIAEALYMYEQKGEKALFEISRNLEQNEYTDSVNEIRKAERIAARIERKYGKSPEEILIEREERAKIIHFLAWLKPLILNKSEEEWQIWRDVVLLGKSVKQVAKERGLSVSCVYKRNRSVMKLIKEMTKYYDEQYGSLKEYLED